MKSRLLLTIFTVLLIATGIVLDALRVTFLGVTGLWLSLLLIVDAGTIVILSISKKTFRGVSFAVLELVLSLLFGLLAFTDLTIVSLYPLIPLSMFLPLSILGLVYRERSIIMVGVSGLVVTIGLLIGALWSYLVVGIFVLVVLIITLCVKLAKREKKYEIPRISIIERANKIKEDNDV